LAAVVAVLAVLLFPASALAVPETSILTGPSGVTNDSTPTFTFESDDGNATFECRVDEDAFAACSSPHELAELDDGPHTFEVRALDEAVEPDPTPASATFTVDTTAPATTILTGPDDLTSDSSPAFTFESDDPDATFECRVDEEDFAACTSPHSLTDLEDGSHTFEVRATDAVGNTEQSPASRSFTVDTTSPTTTINSGPSGLTTDNTPTFAFSSDDPDATFECRVDAGAFAACTSSHTSSVLADGAHTFEVRARDEAGNVDSSPASRTFTVDTTAPDTTIDSGPSGQTADSTPTFTFSSDDPDATFECRVDSVPFAACSGPGDAHTTAALSEGPHAFSVRGTDEAGNVESSPATRSFTVDTINPDTTIDSGPDGPTSETTPTFAFSSSKAGSTFACRVDGGSFGACSGPGASHTTAELSDGPHTFEVRATDGTGNTDTSPATRSFTVDTVAPVATITRAPKGKVKSKQASRKVEIAFGGEDGAEYACNVDDGAFKPCTSPFKPKLKAKAGKGKRHTVSVRATDTAGNVGEVDTARFTVVRIRLLRPQVARRTVIKALNRHGFAHRVVKRVNVSCSRSRRNAFKCRFGTRFPGYRLKGSGKIQLGAKLSYRLRVSAQGVRFTLTDENED